MVGQTGRGVIAAGILTVATTLSTMTISTHALASVPVEHHELSLDSVRESARYLVQTYGVSESEALRRLELQDDAQGLGGRLADQKADNYAGMFLDQAGGGTLVVNAVRPRELAPYLAGMPDRAHVRTRTVGRSLQQLRTIKADLIRTLGVTSDSVYLPEVDTATNQVVIWNREWLAATNTAAQAARVPGLAGLARPGAADLAGAVRREVNARPAAVVVKPLVLGHPLSRTLDSTPNVDWGFCHPLYCSGYGPMRGGIRLDMARDNGTWGGCTAGFNLRSTNGTLADLPWVLTAGHCVTGANHTNAIAVQHNGNDVLNHHDIQRNSYPYDYAILGYSGTAAATWIDSQTDHNKVLLYCRDGGLDSDSDTPCGPQATSRDLSITGYTDYDLIQVGFIACATGSGSSASNYPDSVDSGAGDGYLVGTRCGRVTGKDAGIVTDICARAGDSGGPLFSQADAKAYGILEGNLQDRAGACENGEENNYSPISKILSDVNADATANQGSTFDVISTPLG